MKVYISRKWDKKFCEWLIKSKIKVGLHPSTAKRVTKYRLRNKIFYEILTGEAVEWHESYWITKPFVNDLFFITQEEQYLSIEEIKLLLKGKK